MFLGQRIDYNGRNDYWVSKILYTYVIREESSLGRDKHAYMNYMNYIMEIK